MAINLSQIRDLLWPGVMAVTGQYGSIDTQYSKIFTKKTSKMANERTVAMRMLGLAQLKLEGAATKFDNSPGEAFVYNMEHTEIGLGYAVTRKAIDDNQYKQEFPLSNLSLQRSFVQTKEIFAANVFNLANVYNPMLQGDGQSLCSTAHPLSSGQTFANRPNIDVDLGESTLLAAQNAIRTNFRDNAGLKIQARARRLILHPNNEPVAIRLMKSELRPGTSDNDVNAIRYTAGGLPGGYVVLDYLTNPFAWFIQTDLDGLLWLQRIPFETSMHTDFITDNLLVKGYERYSFGYNDPRAIWGSFPTS